MGLEAGTFVNDLVTTNPPGTDPILQGDDHLRLVKTVLKNTFPNADKAFYLPDFVTKTANYTIVKADINKFIGADATSGSISLTLPTLAAGDDGWYVYIQKINSANTVTIVGTVNGTVDPILFSQHHAMLIYWTGAAWRAIRNDLLATDNTWSGGQTFDKFFALSRDITPAQITADQNDYAPTDHDKAVVFRLDTDAFRSLTGLAGGTDGRVVIIYNIGANTLGLSHENASSSAANRFSLPGAKSVFINNNAAAILQYDNTAQRWRVLSMLTYADQAKMEAATDFTAFVNPTNMHNHPGHPKCWGEFSISGTIFDSYNITSITDTAVGAVTVTIGTDFATANWGCYVSRSEDDMTNVYSATYDAKAAGTVILRSVVEAGSGSDPTSASGNASWSFLGLGDHA